MSRSLAARYAAGDLRKNAGVDVALAVVLVLSAFLMATGAMVVERVFGSIDRLFEQAKPPHFLQMHVGEYDRAALESFAAEHPEIDAWVVEEMIGFDGAAVAWQRPGTQEAGDLADSLVDNLFVTQNAELDFLLDESGAVPRPSEGEVYVPVAYQQRFDLRVGDELEVTTDDGAVPLRVEGFVRDSQMASSLSPATRFLVSEADHAALEAGGGGAPEIIAEYRVTHQADLGGLQRAYQADPALPKNGEEVTYPMIRLINALSDGLVAVALMFASGVLVAIALLNLRFVIRGALEDEVREIGAMKAIGIRDAEISGLYLAKYRVMTALACVVGGGLAVAATTLLTRRMEVSYAAAPWELTTVLVPLGALALVYVVVVAICRGILRAVRKVEVVDALVHGSILGERQTARRARRQARRLRRGGLAAGRTGKVDVRLALADLRSDAGQWALVPVVFLLATLLVVLPTSLLNTLESPRFLTNMGMPRSDVLADLRFTDDVDGLRDDVLSDMAGDDRLTEVRAFAEVLYESPSEDGWATLRVDVGDHAGTIELLDGELPAAGQVALSTLNAQKFGVGPGDELTLRQDGATTTAVVSGVYQDITSGGDTAKMPATTPVADVTGAAGYAIHASTAPGADPAAVAAEYAERYPDAAVVPTEEYTRQTMATMTGALRNAAAASLAFGVGVALLITSLFLKLRLTRERRTRGILSAVGFSRREIVAQVRAKTLAAAALGTALGLLVAATAGELVVGGVMASANLGLARLDLVPDPWLVYLAYPLLLVSAAGLAAVALTARLRRADTSAWLRS